MTAKLRSDITPADFNARSVGYLPESAENFMTIELKDNFFATRKTGALRCVVSEVHAGRNMQVRDVEVA